MVTYKGGSFVVESGSLLLTRNPNYNTGVDKMEVQGHFCFTEFLGAQVYSLVLLQCEKAPFPGSISISKFYSIFLLNYFLIHRDCVGNDYVSILVKLFSIYVIHQHL